MPQPFTDRGSIKALAPTKNGAKAALVFLSLATGYDQYSARLSQLVTASWPLTATYLVMLAAFVSALLAAAFIRNSVLRWLHAIVLGAAATFWEANRHVTGEFTTYDAFVSQIDAFSFVNEAVTHYWHSIVAGALSSSLLLIGIGLKPERSRPSRPGRRARSWLVVSPVAALLLLTVVLFARGGDGGRGLPGMYVALAYANLFAYEQLTDSVGPRERVGLSRPGSAPAHDIVLIVDESVSANYLDINTPLGVPTPLTEPPAGVRVHNFGYGAAITNCSAGVNYTLRFGGTRENYARINARMPSIWQYARLAGLQTVFIDAQRTGGMLINRMNEEELHAIDRWIQYDTVAVRDRDMAVADTLIALFADDVRQFVYVNKMGAHFPVHDKAPDEFVRYRPALPRGRYENVADTGLRFGVRDTAPDWALYRNSYRNTLLWTVGAFFTRLFDSGQLDRAVIVYTSDHGQDLHERGNPGLSTHCTQTPMMEEGLVPLVVVHGAETNTLDWSRHLDTNRNRSSHFNIFPSLLQVMGYELDALQAIYGRPLTMPTDDPFTFNIRFNARLGSPPKWKYIDLRHIVLPPADSDEDGHTDDPRVPRAAKPKT